MFVYTFNVYHDNIFKTPTSSMIVHTRRPMSRGGASIGTGARGYTPVSASPSKESSITVAVRVRPFTAAEECNLVKTENDQFFLGDGSFSSYDSTPSKRSKTSPRGLRKIVKVVDERMLIFDPPETNPIAKMQREAFPNSVTSRIREHRFVFDRLFDVSASQEDVYFSTTRPLLDSVLDGFNSTVFAYGATGCGKTHTISGTPSNPGVIFLTMKELYQKIEDLSDTKLIDVSLSFLEIYNETIRDLLNPTTSHKKLVLREDSAQRISVTNLSSHKPESVEQVMELILSGNQNRTSSPTEANLTSSRSHAVLQINVVQKNRTPGIQEEHTFATLSIIDLAGSERAAATKNRGARLNEGANINKSLLALGNCINALCDPGRRNHVPYRDSKLTRLLKFSLGGNCKTVMIVCVSPSSQHYDETLNTLKYADRAKEIKTKLIRNQHNLDRHVGSYLKMITEQKQEIEELRARESKVIDVTLTNQAKIREACTSALFQSIDSISMSLRSQNHEKWKKYFILAKRKILLLQRIDADQLSTGFAKILSHYDDLSVIRTMMNLAEQLVHKIDTQIADLEAQYSKPCELDHVINESSSQILRRLKEKEGWLDSDSAIFEQLVVSLNESLERDILFNSSILFDHLVHQLSEFNFVSTEFINVLSAYSKVDGTANVMSHSTGNSSEVRDHISLVSKNVITSLESLVNGDFDSALEQSTSLFMQEKINQQDETEYDEDYDFEANSNNSNSTKSTENDESLKGIRKEFKKPVLKSSPPRHFKRAISKKPITPKFSPVRRNSKKVRWDVPKSDSTMLESDVSMDDSMQHNMLKSDLDSPLGENILPDELDLAFDPNLDSPPVPIVKKDLGKPSRKSSEGFINKRLSVNLEPTKTNQLSDNLQNPTSIPLLNKQASTKVLASNGPSYIPGPSSITSPVKISSMTPAGVINTFSKSDSGPTRNIESIGSEKVE